MLLCLPPFLTQGSWILSSSCAGHSPQRWSDVTSVSPQSLQVDGRDSLHLDRWLATLHISCILIKPWSTSMKLGIQLPLEISLILKKSEKNVTGYKKF